MPGAQLSHPARTSDNRKLKAGSLFHLSAHWRWHWQALVPRLSAILKIKIKHFNFCIISFKNMQLHGAMMRFELCANNSSLGMDNDLQVATMQLDALT